MTNDQMREAFDRIMGDPTMPSQDDPEYDQWLFRKVWQAAYAAGMESAARICDAREAEVEDEWGPYNDHGAAACADAIRAEIPKGGKE